MSLVSSVAEGTIAISGIIGQDLTAEEFKAALKEHNGADVKVILDSEGGVVTDGLSIYTALAEYTGNVHVHIHQMCASIATVIACAGDKISMNNTAKYMIHCCWLRAMGNHKELARLTEMATMLDNDMATLYSARTGQSNEALLAAMEKETWYSAEEAKAAGFIDEVVDVRKRSATPRAEAKRRPISVLALVRAKLADAGSDA